MKKIGLILITFFIGLKVTLADTFTKEATFVRCVDGDTAVFNVDGQESKFRFLAIDTPETVHPTKDAEVYGKDASEYTCNKLTNAKSIIIEYEKSNMTDKYGRSLGWIWVDGSLLQKEIVAIGYGKVAYIYGDYRYTESLCLVQKSAQDSSLGLWNDRPEVGYCSTVNLEGVTDNIIFASINEPIPSKESSENKTEEKSNEDVLNKINDITNVTDKITDIVDSEGFSNLYVYIFIGIAAIVVVAKEIKK